MPIQLEESQTVVVPEKTIKAETYPLAWVSQIHIVWPHGTGGTAVIEMHPMSGDGKTVLYRTPEGGDTVIQGRVENMMEAMGRCPELAAAMGPLIHAIHAWNKIVVDDAAEAAKKKAEEENAGV